MDPFSTPMLESLMASTASWIESQERTTGELSRYKVSSNRPNSTLNFVQTDDTQAQFPPGLDPFPQFEALRTPDQDKILIQDLLYVMSGVDGNLISAVHPIPSSRPAYKIEFMVDPRVDSSMQDMVLQISQLAGHYYTVLRYVENWSKFECGKVNQALAAHLRLSIKEYLILVAEMEVMHNKGELTLQKLWFLINPTLQTLAILSSIVIAIEEAGATGGQVLTILHEKTLSMLGDATGQALCFELSKYASQPYFAILEKWIYKGVINDPFLEFFIFDDEVLVNGGESTDDYWERRYKLLLDKCPSFLKKVSQEILEAGKYLNVIRQCGKVGVLYMGAKITYTIHEREYIEVVEKAYSFASKSLLDLLLKDYDLIKRLESVKHHLLMDQGDFIVQFLDLTESELKKEVDDLNVTRLTSLLELALRTSSSGNDPYKDSVKVELFPYGIREQMQKIIAIVDQSGFGSQLFPDDEVNFRIPGVEAFALSYEVQWPISLVIHQRALTCYQLIFRHLFYCKHVERLLCRVWIAGKNFKNISLMTDVEKASAFSLRQKMLNFVQNLQYYVSFEVIEPAWHNFLAKMSKVKDADKVMKYHQEFIDEVLDESMLTNSDTLTKMSRLLALCLEFSKKFLSDSEDSSQRSASKISKKESSLKSTETINAKFTTALVEFLKGVSAMVQNPNKSTKVVNIIHRMNFNSYYTSALENGECELDN